MILLFSRPVGEENDTWFSCIWTFALFQRAMGKYQPKVSMFWLLRLTFIMISVYDSFFKNNDFCSSNVKPLPGFWLYGKLQTSSISTIYTRFGVWSWRLAYKSHALTITSPRSSSSMKFIRQTSTSNAKN
jgi:hypothetical protein